MRPDRAGTPLLPRPHTPLHSGLTPLVSHVELLSVRVHFQAERSGKWPFWSRCQGHPLADSSTGRWVLQARPDGLFPLATVRFVPQKWHLVTKCQVKLPVGRTLAPFLGGQRWPWRAARRQENKALWPLKALTALGAPGPDLLGWDRPRNTGAPTPERVWARGDFQMESWLSQWLVTRYFVPSDNLEVIKNYLHSISSSINSTPKITLRSRH